MSTEVVELFTTQTQLCRKDPIEHTSGKPPVLTSIERKVCV